MTPGEIQIQQRLHGGRDDFVGASFWLDALRLDSTCFISSAQGSVAVVVVVVVVVV